MRDMRIAENIASGRRTLGCTQAALAESLGVTKAAVSKWELGQSLPDVAMLPRIASLLGTTTDELIGWEPQMGEEELATFQGHLAAPSPERAEELRIVAERAINASLELADVLEAA